MRVIVALRALWRVLINKNFYRRVDALLKEEGNSISGIESSMPKSTNQNVGLQLLNNSKSDGTKECLEGRSDALELLTALQRDARFIDFIKESWDGVDDATIASVSRVAHDRCASTLERLFEIRTLTSVEEGEILTFTSEEAKRDARYHFTGGGNNMQNASEMTGIVVHPGWRVQKVSLPHWSGSQEDSMILAPIELESCE